MYSTRDKLVVFATEAVRGVLRSHQFRSWCAEASLWFFHWVVEFARDPVNEGSKL